MRAIEKALLQDLLANLDAIQKEQRDANVSGNPVTIAEAQMLESKLIKVMMFDVKSARERGMQL